MNYWINSHWPPFLKHKPTPTSRDPEYHYRVYLPDGRQDAGQALARGDLVFIYETKWGRPRKDRQRYAEPGRQKIIALVSVRTPIRPKLDEKREEYTDGSAILWKWQARTQVKKPGFCSHNDVCRILGYKIGYTFHGFGDQHSGLKRIDEETYKALLKCLRSGA
jgi:hypothetical protein